LQTFLPMIRPHAAARCLRDAELQTQLRNCLIILRSVYDIEKIPSLYAKAWEGYKPALAVYSLAMLHEARIIRRLPCDIWQAIAAIVADEQAYEGARQEVVWPPWIGDLAIHRSHRSTLIAWDEEHYGPLWPNNPLWMPLLYPDPSQTDGQEYHLRIHPGQESALMRGYLQLPMYLQYDFERKEVLRVKEL
jgi:hypothetical protein